MLFFNFAIIYFQLIQELKKENFDLKLRLYMEQKEREVSHCGVGVHAQCRPTFFGCKYYFATA